MNRRNPDRISMLVDGELEEWELNGTLQALEQDAEMQSCWRNYHLIGDAMRGHLPNPLCSDLGDRVSRALKHEPTYFPPRTASLSSPSRFTPRKTAAGFALAASLTAIAVVGVMDIGQRDRLGAASAMVADGASAMVADQATPRFMYTFAADVSDLPATLPSPGNPGALSAGSIAPAGAPRVSTVAASQGLPLANDLTDYLMNYQRYSARSEQEDTLSYLRLVGHEE